LARKDQIKIHQAFYGEVNRSHGCLCSTIENAVLKTFLTGFTDRPSSLPAGITMEPYYSATVYGKHYVFAKTSPDNTAQRAGMVFTHVLITDVEDIECISNLESLFGYFYKTIPEHKTLLQELIIPVSSLEVEIDSDSFPKFVLLGAQELISGKLPILFCGASEAFIDLIAPIWAGLPKSFRAKISYTAGFSTTNIDTSKTFIVFQGDLEESLRASKFISDKNNNLAETNNTVERYILTPHADNQFELFIKELNVNLDSWIILQSCAKAYEAYKNYTELTNDALKQLIRQLAKISPDKNNGRSIKTQIVAETVKRIKAEKEINLKSLKNLPLDAFSNGEEMLADTVGAFVENELNRSQNFNDRLISEVIIVSCMETQLNWWHNAVIKAFKKTIGEERAISFQNLWQVLMLSKDSMSAILSFLPNDKKQEGLLIKYFPKNVPKQFAEHFAKVILTRKWLLLHAYLIQTYLASKEAAKQQLHLEKNASPNSFEGTKHIIKNVSDQDLLSLTMETNESYFIAEYAVRSTKKPALLHRLDVKNPIWLSIWANSLEETNDLEHGILSLSEKVDQLLNDITEGKNVPDAIVHQLAHSKYADISRLKSRVHLWKHLRPGIKQLFLDATANELIKNISTEGLTNVTIETELSNHISTERFMSNLLETYRSDINTVLEIFEYIDGCEDGFLAKYIRYYTNSLNDIQSARLGNLILSKQFRLSAKQIFNKAKTNKIFKIALTKCQSIAGLDFWDRLSWGWLIGETVSADSVFSELMRISVRLYDKGPEENDIWKRAGGDVSKLHNHRSREENWQNAIRLLRNGGGGNISVESLIKEMMEEHPNNSELKEIAKYFK